MRVRLKREERLFFTEQISLLLSAGVPIVSALELLVRSAKRRSLRVFIKKLKKGVESGGSISSILVSFPASFSPLYVALVEVGEVSGKLPAMFHYLGKIERDRLLALKAIRKALIYPVMVVLVALGVLLFILIAVVPTFEMLYESGGVELPIVTQKVLSVSAFLLSTKGVWLLGYLLLASLVVRRFFRRRGKFREWIDRLLLKVPLIGRLLLANFNAGFSQVVSVMISSGIPLVRSVQLYQGGVANLSIKQKLMVMESSLQRGDSFSETAKESGVFTDVALTLISVGEMSGSLVLVLERSGEYHAEIVSQRVDAFIALIDPLSLVLIGGVVGVILVALYLPMFNMGMAI